MSVAEACHSNENWKAFSVLRQCAMKDSVLRPPRGVHAFPAHRIDEKIVRARSATTLYPNFDAATQTLQRRVSMYPPNRDRYWRYGQQRSFRIPVYEKGVAQA